MSAATELAEHIFDAAAKYCHAVLPPGSPSDAFLNAKQESIVIGLCQLIVEQAQRIDELERRVSSIDGEGMGK